MHIFCCVIESVHHGTVSTNHKFSDIFVEGNIMKNN